MAFLKIVRLPTTRTRSSISKENYTGLPKVVQFTNVSNFDGKK